MRKKIPTVTRPDPTYAASLRQDGVKIPGREEEGSVEPSDQQTNAVTCDARDRVPESETIEAPEGPITEVTPAKATADPPSVAKGSHPTRKIDIRVNALARQEAALLTCGVDPAHVIRAALRRAVKDWQLGPVYAAPCKERRTRNTGWQARTSLAVDASRLQVLLRDHDPLDVLSKWASIRGQVEPRVWAEIDVVLDEIAALAAVREGPETSDPDT